MMTINERDLIKNSGNFSRIMKFQKTDFQANNNKYWHVYVMAAEPSVEYIVHYGRVGSFGNLARKTVSPRAFQTLVNNKVSEGYSEIPLHKPSPEVDAVAASEPEADASEPNTKAVLELVEKEAGAGIKRYLVSPVEDMSLEHITAARELLQAIQQERIEAERFKLVERYYNYIPTILPPKIEPSAILAEFAPAMQEDRLNQLAAAVRGLKTRQQLNDYGVRFSFVDPQAESFAAINQRVQSSVVPMHGFRMKVEQLFELEIPGERERYRSSKVGGQRFLFHGTRAEFVRHILPGGLIVPKIPSSGRMFGDGIYFASNSTKSGLYCSSRFGMNMMFVAQVNLGNIYVSRTSHHYKQPPAGHDSVMGKGGYTGGLLNDEYIVYNPGQQTIRYLILWQRL